MHKIAELGLIFPRFWGVLTWPRDLCQPKRFPCLGRVSCHVSKWQLYKQAWLHNITRYVYRRRWPVRKSRSLHPPVSQQQQYSSSAESGTLSFDACTAKEARWLDCYHARGSSRCSRRGHRMQVKNLEGRGSDWWGKNGIRIPKHLSSHETWIVSCLFSYGRYKK